MNVTSKPIRRVQRRLVPALLCVLAMLLNSCGPAFKMPANGPAGAALVTDSDTAATDIPESQNSDGRTYTTASKDGELQKLQEQLAGNSANSELSKTIDWLSVDRFDANGASTSTAPEQLVLKLSFTATSGQSEFHFNAKLKKATPATNPEILPTTSAENPSVQVAGHCFDVDCQQLAVVLKTKEGLAGLIYRDRFVSIHAKSVQGLEGQDKADSVTTKMRDRYLKASNEHLLTVEMTDNQHITLAHFRLPLTQSEICVSGDLVSTISGDQSLKPFCGPTPVTNLDVELIGNAADGNMLMAIRNGRASVYIIVDVLDGAAASSSPADQPDYFTPEVPTTPESHDGNARNSNSSPTPLKTNVIIPSIEPNSQTPDVVALPISIPNKPLTPSSLLKPSLTQLQPPIEPSLLQLQQTSPRADVDLSKPTQPKNAPALPAQAAPAKDKPLPLAFKPQEPVRRLGPILQTEEPPAPLSRKPQPTAPPVATGPVTQVVPPVSTSKQKPTPIVLPTQIPSSKAEPKVKPAPTISTEDIIPDSSDSSKSAIPVDIKNPITRAWSEDRDATDIKAAIQKWASRPDLGNHFRGLRANFSELAPILREQDIPNESLFIAVIESGFFSNENYPILPSTEGALGPWQLMAQTARRLGLTYVQKAWAKYGQVPDRRDPKRMRRALISSHFDPCDERTDMVTSTKAAAQYLRFLYDYFPGNPKLAIMGYNLGEGGAKNVKKRFEDIKSVGFNFRGAVAHGLAGPNPSYVSEFVAIFLISLDPDKYDITIPDSAGFPRAPHLNCK
jgi:hypothetical protein